MYNIGNLPQIINTLNSMLLGIRSEVDNLKSEINVLKNAAQPSTTNVDELQAQITCIHDTLGGVSKSQDNNECNLKTIHDKMDALEKSLSDKVVSLHQIVNDKDKHHKQETQKMIDQSIALLLDGLRPTTTTHDNPAFAPLSAIDEGDEAAILVTDTEPTTIDPPHQDDIQQTETPKPKGRGGRKKKVVQ